MARITLGRATLVLRYPVYAFALRGKKRMSQGRAVSRCYDLETPEPLPGYSHDREDRSSGRHRKENPSRIERRAAEQVEKSAPSCAARSLGRRSARSGTASLSASGVGFRNFKPTPTSLVAPMII